MAAGFGRELIRFVKPKMKAELIVQPIVSLEIKLRLEKLRLAELISADDSRTGMAAGMGSNSEGSDLAGASL
jgi:hypothetical protein